MDTIPVIYQSVMSKNVEHEINSEQRILELQETFEMISSIPHCLLKSWNIWLARGNRAGVQGNLILRPVSVKWTTLSTLNKMAQALPTYGDNESSPLLEV